jgi:hypothetical protein
VITALRVSASSLTRIEGTPRENGSFGLYSYGYWTVKKGDWAPDRLSGLRLQLEKIQAREAELQRQLGAIAARRTKVLQSLEKELRVAASLPSGTDAAGPEPGEPGGEA